jgi:hypothetical protein
MLEDGLVGMGMEINKAGRDRQPTGIYYPLRGVG